MTPWQAFFQAAGLASANSQLYMGIALTALITMIVQMLTRLYKMEFTSPQQKVMFCFKYLNYLFMEYFID